MGNQVFISYKHDIHDDLLTLLKQYLEKWNYLAWTDDTLIAGDEWMRTIDNAIDNSMAIIVFMSKEASSSTYVAYEWAYALGARKPLIIMLLDKDAELHQRLQRLQYSDFTGKNRPWERLEKALEAAKKSAQTNGIVPTTNLAPQNEQPSSNVELALKLMNIGDFHLQHNDIDEAIKAYQRAYRVADDSLMTNIALIIARIYIQQAELSTEDHAQEKELLDKAEQQLQQILTDRPDQPMAMAYCGYINRLRLSVVPRADRRQQLDFAQTNLHTALRQAPTLLDHNGESWWNTYGGVLRRVGDMEMLNDAATAKIYYEKAIDAYQRAASVKPSSYPYGNLAILNLQLGKIKAMKDSYHRVEFYPPSDVGDFWGHGDQLVARLVRQDVKGAETYYKTYMAFVEDYAIDALLETLGKIEKLIDPQTAVLVREFIDRIKNERGQR